MTGHPERASAGGNVTNGKFANGNVSNGGTTRIRSATADVLIALGLVTVIAFSIVGQSPTGRSGPLASPLYLSPASSSIGAASFAPWQVWAAGNGYRDASVAPLTAPAAAASRTKGPRSAYVLMSLLFTVLLAANISFLGYLGCTYASSRRVRRTGGSEGGSGRGDGPVREFALFNL